MFFLDFLCCFISFLHDFGAVCVVTRWCFFDRILPHYKLFETQAQFIVVTEEFRVRWDLIQEDLRHLQRALQQRRGSGERRRRTKTKRVRDKERESKKHKKSGGRKEGKRLRVHEQRRDENVLHSDAGK